MPMHPENDKHCLFQTHTLTISQSSHESLSIMLPVLTSNKRKGWAAGL